MRKSLIFVIALAFVAPIVAGVVTHTVASERWVSVEATISSDPVFTGGDEGGDFAADVRAGDLVANMAVAAQAQPGDEVTGYVDTRTGQLWRASTAGSSPNPSVVVGFVVAWSALAVVLLVKLAGDFAAEVARDQERAERDRAWR